ncbi:DUF6946 family protein [Salipaludibacillus sp. CF4.18]|uniref:DUF6946 family protein n=1 Tax=Salipaludibacillus sp. CF4.18 TaxID=3373081 RepID=UPI003EE5EB90
MGSYYTETQGIESWKNELSEPEKQWKSGLSAKELALSWEEANGFPLSIQEAFQDSGIPLFKDTTFLFGFPEYKIPLPGGGTSSQNDLYVLAKASDELLTIMVDGKVSEPFGKTVGFWRGTDPSSAKRKKLAKLLTTLKLEEEDVLNKRYQLLHQTVSALIEAKRVQAKNTLLLIHSFSKTASGFDEYCEFVKMFELMPLRNSVVGPVLLNGVDVYFGWVTEVNNNINIEENETLQAIKEKNTTIKKDTNKFVTKINHEVMYSADRFNNDINIGEFVNTTLIGLIKNRQLSNEMVEWLTDTEYCKEVFDINYPVLKKLDETVPSSEQRKIRGYNRYWTKIVYIHQARYLICNDWHERNRVKYQRWLVRVENK